MRVQVLYQKALATSPLSLCVPYLSFTPSFLVLTAFVFVGEVPSTAGLAGVVVVTLGGFLLSKQGSSSSSTGASNSSSGDKPVTPAKAVSAAHHTPTTHLAGGPASPAGTSPADKVAVVVTCSSPITSSTASLPWVWEPGALLMLAVAAMWSVTASLDKLGVVHAPSLWVYAALQRLAIGSAAALYLALVSPGSFRLLCSRHLGVLLLLSLAELLAVVLFLEAIKFVFVSYVVAIKRANILMSLIVGGCCFGERVWRRLPAVLIMVSGMLLIITDPSPSFRASSVHQAVGDVAVR
ncbi:hypothetical protein V8C86DRAFT_1781989 [Haematococcus lacustris]